MLTKIAVEKGLDSVANALAQQGYRVVHLDSAAWREAQAVVVNGMDSSFLGIRDSLTAAPVIVAAGRTPVEVLNEIKTRIGEVHPGSARP